MVNETLRNLHHDVLFQWAYLAALGVFILALTAEFFHARRIRRNAHLIFGPEGKVPVYIPFASILRVCGATLLAFSFTFLMQWWGTFEPNVGAERPEKILYPHHMVFAYDISPSMFFARDAGPSKKQLRRERARDIYQSVVSRLKSENCLYSLLVFWTDVKAVALDTFDLAILDNAFGDLPLPYAMKSGGKTELTEVLKKVSDISRDWPENTATLVVISDGDVLPESGLPKLPAAFANVLVFGVGDPSRGVYVNDHLSRQSKAGLNDLANRYSGLYFNANENYPGTEFFNNIRAVEGVKSSDAWNWRALAKYMMLLGALLYAIPTLLLSFAATHWLNLVQRSRS